MNIFLSHVSKMETPPSKNTLSFHYSVDRKKVTSSEWERKFCYYQWLLQSFSIAVFLTGLS